MHTFEYKKPRSHLWGFLASRRYRDNIKELGVSGQCGESMVSGRERGINFFLPMC